MKIHIKVSWWLAGTLVFAHTGAVLVVTRLPLPIAVLLVLVGVLLISLVRAFRRQVLRDTARAVTGVEIQDDGNAAIRRHGSPEWCECEIRDAFVHPWLVVVQVMDRNGRQRVAIPRDTVATAEFRRLRAWLRWRRAPGEGDQDGDRIVSAGGRVSSGRG